MNLLHTQQLTVTAGARQLITEMNWAIEPGQCWAIIGPNGSGKSRLLHTLVGLSPAQAGEVFIQNNVLHGLNYRQRAHRLGLLFQHSERGLHGRTLELVLGGSLGGHYWHSAEEQSQAKAALDAVGLTSLAQVPVEQLSGGELRRAEIARLLMQNPSLALLDEPNNHLDISQQGRILALLQQKFVNDQQALVMVLHDLQLATQFASHLLLLDGKGNWQAGPINEIANAENFSRTLGHPIRCLNTGEERVWLTT